MIAELVAFFKSIPVPPVRVMSILAVVVALRTKKVLIIPAVGKKFEPNVVVAGKDKVASWTLRVTSIIFSLSKSAAKRGTTVPVVDVALMPPPCVTAPPTVNLAVVG